VTLAAAILRAADSPSVPGDQPLRMTSVVRSDPRTGKLVRSVMLNPKPVAGRTVAGTVVASPCGFFLPRPRRRGVPRPALGRHRRDGGPGCRARILAPSVDPLGHPGRSNYDPYAVSPKGAQGLMQLIPATARRFGVTDAFNPADNIQGGARYLRYLLELYKGDYPLALAAYNAGEGAVAKYGGVPPYAETRDYLVRIGSSWRSPWLGSPSRNPWKPNRTPAGSTRQRWRQPSSGSGPAGRLGALCFQAMIAYEAGLQRPPSRSSRFWRKQADHPIRAVSRGSSLVSGDTLRVAIEVSGDFDFFAAISSTIRAGLLRYPPGPPGLRLPARYSEENLKPPAPAHSAWRKPFPASPASCST